MKRTWTIIGVSDVARSFKWYQSLLGLPETLPAHDDFGQILDADGTVLLCLHQWGATSTLRWSAQTAQSLETDYSCSFVWMISTRHCQESARWWPPSQRSLT